MNIFEHIFHRLWCVFFGHQWYEAEGWFSNQDHPEREKLTLVHCRNCWLTRWKNYWVSEGWDDDTFTD